MTQSENFMPQSTILNTMSQPTILLAAKKNKPKNPDLILDPDYGKRDSSKQYCQDLLGDVKALLDGGGKEIKDPAFYKVGGRSLLPDGLRGIKSSIMNRIADLRSDQHDLFNNHRKLDEAHPKHGSYVGHQSFVKDQQAALRKAVTTLENDCKKFTPEEQALIDRAKEGFKTPIPQKPDPKFRQNSATASESQKLKQAIDSIPGMSQSQKDATRKALENTGIPKIIKDSVNGGKEYWEKTGKQQLKTALDTLVNAGKIAGVVAVVILEFVGKLATGQLVSNPQNTTETPSIASTDKTVVLNEDSTNSQTINPAPTPVATTSTNTLESKQPISSTPFTSTIPNSQSNSNSKLLVSGKETNIVAENTNQTSANTATNLTTQSSQTNLQATASMGETAAVAQANNAKLQEILARMQVRAPQTSNKIAATTSEINQESIATNPNTNRLVTSSDVTTPALTGTVPSSTALTGNVPSSTALTETVPSSTALTGTVPSSTALTGNVPSSTALTETVPSSTALTGNVPSSTALTGTVPSNTALTGTIAGSESSKPTQLQPEMALS
jgi:hypothetical protein